MMISAMEIRAEQIYYECIKGAKNTESEIYEIATLSIKRLEVITEILYTALEKDDKKIEIV